MAPFAEPLQIAVRTGTSLSCSSTDTTAAVPAGLASTKYAVILWRVTYATSHWCSTTS
jgi:hypothetical protein